MIEYCLGIFIVLAVDVYDNITSLFLLCISGTAHDQDAGKKNCKQNL